jgi:hypothetical protein
MNQIHLSMAPPLDVAPLPFLWLRHPLEVNFAALHMKAAATGSCQAAPCTREGHVLDSAPRGREDQDL